MSFIDKKFQKAGENFLSWSWVEPLYLCEAWMKMRHPVTDDLRVEKLDWTQAEEKVRYNSNGEVTHQNKGTRKRHGCRK
jgi:hypothetical protein